MSVSTASSLTARLSTRSQRREASRMVARATAERSLSPLLPRRHCSRSELPGMIRRRAANMLARKSMHA